MSTKKIKTYHGTPLHFAMISNKRKEIIKLIDENIDQVMMKDSNEEYPLVLAVRYECGYDVVKKLLTIYPNVLKDIIWIDNKTNVMHYIIESCTEHEKLEYYIDLICGQNKELLNLRDHKKRNPLQLVCVVGHLCENDKHVAIKKFLLFPDIDINNQDINGNTALQLCHWKLIPVFFSYEGINLDIQDKNGYSVL